MSTAPASGPDEHVVAVLCAEDRPPAAVESAAGVAVRYAGAGDLADAVAGADVLLVWDFLSSEVADAWPSADQVRWVHAASAGVDRLMFPDLRDSDVVVTNSRGVFERPIAEYVLGLVLAFAKDLPGTWDLQQRRQWRHRETETVQGRTALVVGSGPIGREIGRLLAAVGLQVRLVGRSTRPDREFGTVHGSDRLLELAGDADFVVGAVPLTPETTDLFDRRLFDAMPRHARFVNVGRGPSVVEDDLVRALERGDIAGAGLDVFSNEPLPTDSSLWRAERLLVSPHMSGDAAGWQDRLATLFLDNLERWRDGAPLLNVVDKQRGYVPDS